MKKEVIFENRQQWLRWRQQGLGSSDATILASDGLVEPPKWLDRLSVQRLYWDKLGMGKKDTDNPAMRRGREMEELARAMAERQLGFIAPVNLEREDEPWMRASLDGITLDDEIVEIKVPGDSVVSAARAGTIVGYYQAQIAHQLMVLHGHPDGWSGKEMAHFVVFDHKTGELIILSRPSAEFADLARRLYEEERRFWQHVQTRCHPVGGRAWHDLALEVSQAKTFQAQAEAYKDIVRKAVEAGYEPRRFYVRSVPARTSRRTDWESVFAQCGIDAAELERFRAPPVWVLSGGAQDIEVPDMAPEQAEEAFFDKTPPKEVVEDLVERAKRMAEQLGHDLAGPYGMRVYKREGTIAYAKAAEALGIDASIIEAQTHEVQAPACRSLVAKGIKAARSPL